VGGDSPAHTAHGLYMAGVVCLVFGVFIAGVAAFAVARYGAWSMAIPTSILLVGLLFALVGKAPALRAAGDGWRGQGRGD